MLQNIEDLEVIHMFATHPNMNTMKNALFQKKSNNPLAALYFINIWQAFVSYNFCTSYTKTEIIFTAIYLCIIF